MYPNQTSIHEKQKNVNKYTYTRIHIVLGPFLFDFLKRDFPHQRTNSTTTQSIKFFSNSSDFSFPFSFTFCFLLLFFCCVFFGCCCFRKINTTWNIHNIQEIQFLLELLSLLALKMCFVTSFLFSFHWYLLNAFWLSLLL